MCASRGAFRGKCATAQAIWLLRPWRANLVRAAANRSLALSWDIVAMRRHCEAFVQTIVNLMVQVNKTHPAQLQYNGFLVLCPSTACVQNGVEKQ